VSQDPFADVIQTGAGLSLPELKWRELLFIGAMRAEEGLFVRDPSRPLPPFQIPDLFPPGVRFRVRKEDGRIHLEQV
jgi:hypothetical protein